MIRPIYEELEKTTDVEWISAPVSGMKGILWIRKETILRQPEHIVISEYCYNPDPNFREAERYKNKSIFHNHGLAPIDWPSEKDIGWKGVLVPGNLFYKLYARINFPEERLKIVGWPKGDILFKNPEKLKKEVMKDFDLGKRKTLLYSPPMFNPHHSFEIFNHLKRICEGLNINLIVKLHERLTLNIPDMIEEIKKECKDCESFFWVDPNYDNIEKLFLIADVLVSYGGCSTLKEFLQTRKPSIQVLGFGRMDGPLCVSCSLPLLGTSIKQAIEYPWVTDASELFYKMDGKASERAAKAVLELIENE